MGREVKRVPLDFAWPQFQKWEGYQAPYAKQYEPPKGKGWQMWTTTEEAPMSPVFKTPELLAGWLADNKASAMGHQKATYDEWLSMIRQGRSLTGVMDSRSGTVKSGVALARDNADRLSVARKLADQVKTLMQQARGREQDRER